MQRKERAACARGTPSQRLQEDHPTTRPTLEITERVAHTLERVPAGDQTIEWGSAPSGWPGEGGEAALRRERAVGRPGQPPLRDESVERDGTHCGGLAEPDGDSLTTRPQTIEGCRNGRG